MKIGLVLSGAMGKGAYQVGALRAIEEYIAPKDVNYVSAASAGILNAYAFLCGKTELAADFWRSVNGKKERVLIPGLYKSNLIPDAIEELSRYEIEGKCFFYPVVNLKNKRLVYHRLEKIDGQEKEYLRAAVAFPVLSPPVRIDGLNYYDGAIIDNIPVAPLIEYDLDYIICIYFDDYNYTFESEEFDERVVKITFRDRFFDTFCFTRERTEKMLQEGYVRAKNVLDFVFQSGTDDAAKVRRQISLFRDTLPRPTMRFTGDVLVNNFNKVAKKFVSRENVVR